MHKTLSKKTYIMTYMNDINKLISKDVSKLYNERPCKDDETLLSYRMDRK